MLFFWELGRLFGKSYYLCSYFLVKIQMKKSIAIIVALVLFSLTSSAQGFYGGVRGGMNVSSLTKTSYAKAVVRGNFGGFMGFQFSTIAALQVEALYSFQGAKLQVMDAVGTDLQLDYLKIPVMFKLYLIRGLNIEAGVSFNILTSALENWHPAKGYNGFDFSIPVGLAYQFGRHFELGLRYDISTVKYNPERTGVNSLFSVNVAWRF